MQKVLVVGMGLSGKAAARLLFAKGIDFIIYDDKISSYQDFEHQDKALSTPQIPKDVDTLLVAPGIPKEHPLYVEALERGLNILGEVDLALQFLDQICLGITGTNGKTTVTLLVEHVLKASGRKAMAVGNVGTALCDYALRADPEEILVIELSSYQIETLREKKFSQGIILNITPDHLDRYKDFEEYARAKCALKEALKPPASLIVFEKVAEEFKRDFPENILLYGRDPSCLYWTDKKALFKKGEKLLDLPEFFWESGWHESENVLAAFILTEEYVSKEVFAAAITTFQKPHHRIEFIGEVEKVFYYDDSKGTNIDAVIRAVEAMKSPVVLIAGGVDKGFPYTSWKEPFSSKVKKIIVIGEAAEKIKKDLGAYFEIEKALSMEEAVERAASSASLGDSVLLSPGCSSFDMFSDYAHRGKEFQRCVKNLPKRGAVR